MILHVSKGGIDILRRNSGTFADLLCFASPIEQVGVTAEREEGVTNVKESARVESHLEPGTSVHLRSSGLSDSVADSYSSDLASSASVPDQK